MWTEVVIDDFFPVRKNCPIFSSSLNNETWVLIMEKSWAKLHGNYSKISDGFVRESLHDLTGAPSKIYKPEVGYNADHSADSLKNKNIWERIIDGEKKHHAMCASTILYDEDSEEAEEMKNVKGLIPGHIYTVIAALYSKINGKK